MEWFGNPSREDRLRYVAANLARAYSSEPVHVPDKLKDYVRRLKDEPAPKKPERAEVSPG